MGRVYHLSGRVRYVLFCVACMKAVADFSGSLSRACIVLWVQRCLHSASHDLLRTFEPSPIRPPYPQNFIQRPLPAGGNGAGAPPAGTQVSFSAMNYSTCLTILLSHRRLVSYDSLPLPGSSNQDLYLRSTSWCSRTWTDRGYRYREDIPVSCLRSPHPWRYPCGYEMGSIQDDLHWNCYRCSGPHYHDDM